MPEVPVLVKPYLTEKQCPVCHPVDRPEPPKMECQFESAYAGSQVVRNLLCLNCSYREADVFDKKLGRVVLDKALDIAAARGGRL